MTTKRASILFRNLYKILFDNFDCGLPVEKEQYLLEHIKMYIIHNLGDYAGRRYIQKMEQDETLRFIINYCF